MLLGLPSIRWMEGVARRMNSYVFSVFSFICFCFCSGKLISGLFWYQEIKHTGSSSTSETYTIHATLDKTTTISVVFTRPEGASGFKLGQGEEGGYSRFGKDKNDGFVIQLVLASSSSQESQRPNSSPPPPISYSRFHPHVISSGQIMLGGQVLDTKGEAMFVHAIQGLRPDSVSHI
jgi:hypothetical protein